MVEIEIAVVVGIAYFFIGMLLAEVFGGRRDPRRPC